MAKILFEMDTVEKTFAVTVDGKKVDNVDSVTAYKRYYDAEGRSVDDDDEDLCHFELCRRLPEDDGIRRVERICASEKGVETKVEQAKPKPVAQHIADYINARREAQKGRRPQPRR